MKKKLMIAGTLVAILVITSLVAFNAG